MFLDEPLYASDLGAPETAAADQPDRVQPELGNVDVPLDMHMRRLFAVASIEKAAVGAISQHRGHSRTKDSINADASAWLYFRHIALKLNSVPRICPSSVFRSSVETCLIFSITPPEYFTFTACNTCHLYAATSLAFSSATEMLATVPESKDR
jgi:hypothetical protein